MRKTLTLIALAISTPALAAGTVPYGSRAGMEVTVVRMSGLDTTKARIVTKHTRENAISFCRDYAQKVTEDCIKEELSVPLNDSVSANCKTGEFETFTGERLRFAGKSRNPSMSKYRVIDLATKDDLDGSSASGYPVAMMIYKALCPRTAPADY